MIRVLFAFIILSASVYLGILLHDDPGYVLIAIKHWTIETTLWIAVFILLLFFTFVHLVLRLMHLVLKTPKMLSKWHSHHLALKAQATTRKGLIEYSEGYWNKAKNHLIQALPNTDTPLLNYLTAARAAQKMGDSQLRDHYLREAQQSMPEATIAVELTQAQLQLANQQWEQALATLRHLQDLAPKHPYVLKLLMNLYEQVRDWPQLIALLPDLKKHHVITEHAFEQLQQNTYLQALIDLDKQNQDHAVKTLFNSLPKPLVHNPEIVTVYAHFLLKRNEQCAVEHLLRRVSRKEFNTALIELYGLTELCNEKQLNFAESLLKKNPDSAALFLCLGRLCMAQHLWGKARHYLEQSNELAPSSITYKVLGELYEQLNEPFLACDSYKKGLELI